MKRIPRSKSLPQITAQATAAGRGYVPSDIADSPDAGVPKLTTNKGSSPVKDLLYTIEDVPPWHACALLGFQQFISMVGNAVLTPLLVTLKICMPEEDSARSYVISSSLFVSGLTTLLQTTIGTRLPIVQGPSLIFLPPIIAMMQLPEWKCLDESVTSQMSLEERRELWLPRLNEVIGALLVASVVQTFLGLTGAVGLLMNIISPITVAVNIIVIGIGFFSLLEEMMASHWPISIMTLVLVVIFSQYLKEVRVPFPYWLPRRRGVEWIPLFKLLPILLSLLLGWMVCGLLTYADVLPQPPPAGSNQSRPAGVAARTDTGLNAVRESAWFQVPTPGYWGTPTVSLGLILGMTTSVILSVIESIGDYYACAEISKAPPPPISAVNRGIAMEGLGGVVACILGAATGSTSYSNNIGAVGITKVASRRVFQCAALYMVVLGLVGKFGAVFITIPQPVFGGAMVSLFAMICGLGLSMLQHIDLNSTRNVFIIGFSTLMSLMIPDFVTRNPGSLETGYAVLDQVLQVCLSTCIFVAFILSCVLDNTIPGTDEERGMVEWKAKIKGNFATTASHSAPSCYDMPYGMQHLRRWKWTRYIPFSPTFRGFPSANCCRRRRSSGTGLAETSPHAKQNSAFVTSLEQLP